MARIGARQRINPAHEFSSLEWKESFKYRERLIFGEKELEQDLSEFADLARQVSDLVVSRGDGLKERLRRTIYYARLRRGKR